ncbi:hypothetical protein AYO44_10740 [Planctomycetaceae bacterium SCGC AG-212-F19]|nr:hypothetical protein AYO44_10740 [Planctomycetaceae bacterium SCGC AG-212-F19]
MVQATVGKVLRRSLLRLASGPAVPDALLLERFAAEHDEEAFTELVRRHGPMVFRVCRRVLRNVHDVEDAFQATFIVLARKAASVAHRELIAHWLYKVALRVAFKARSRNATFQSLDSNLTPEREAAAGPGSEPDWCLVLHEELAHLDARYAAPLMMCYLQGKSNADVATELGCRTDAVHQRLSRGRAMLRQRLQRRGLALTVAALAALLVKESSAVGAVPLALAERTSQGAALAIAGTGLGGNTPAAVLASAALETMPRSKLAIVAMLLLGALALGGTGLLLWRGGASEPSSVQSLSGYQSIGQLQSLSNVVCNLFYNQASTLQAQFSPPLFPTGLHIATLRQSNGTSFYTETAALTLGPGTATTQQFTLTGNGVRTVNGKTTPVKIVMMVKLTATPQPGSSGPANWYCNSATAVFKAFNPTTGQEVFTTDDLSGFTWARIAGSGG